MVLICISLVLLGHLGASWNIDSSAENSLYSSVLHVLIGSFDSLESNSSVLCILAISPLWDIGLVTNSSFTNLLVAFLLMLSFSLSEHSNTH